ncbi:hypothetical protein LP43_1443 [Methylophaga thiooxydans]|uniref:Uncharacterized protein n=1 Tax=Methylophaga thiooxydans TaxID=392484 RepID=A0A0A0BEI4_9GAMM|nr:hypothetical protein [Methylophaga thiooxydans]KGM06948.1 hypothetical protein LP43_1443 [Methylophaga thiooxydans]
MIPAESIQQFEERFLQSPTNKTKPSSGIQEQREALLKELIHEYGEEKLDALGKNGVWEILQQKAGGLFHRSESTMKDFYKKQKLIKFSPGRKTKHNH